LSRRDDYLRRTYGISQAVYDQMLAEQGGVCAICRHTEGDKPLAVDHSHKTGQVRGLLCTVCNVQVGVVELFGQQAAAYLARFDATKITDDELFAMDLEQ